MSMVSVISEDRLQAQRQRLYKLIEECGEVQHIVGKILIHGIDNYHPSLESEGHTNRCQLEAEIGHVLAIIEIMDMVQDISLDRIQIHCAMKKRVILNQYGY